jgi:uncharacterized protein with beta-barrel porin domain/uncharacterized membrane protein
VLAATSRIVLAASASALALAAGLAAATAADVNITTGTVTYDAATMAGKNLIVSGPDTTLVVSSGATITTMVDLHDGGTVNNSGAITRTGAGNRGIVGGNGNAINQAGGTITSANGSGVLFYEGGTVRNSGSGSLIGAAIYGVVIQGATGSVTNELGAHIAGDAVGVILFAGGDVTNTGESSSISGGVSILGAGGEFSNEDGATVTGPGAAVHLGGGGTITNTGAGSSLSGDVSGVYLENGGIVSNGAGAAIKGGDDGIKADDSVELTNAGVIAGESRNGVDARGGSVTNSGATAQISGDDTGVFLDGIGAVINEDGATIAGGATGVIMNYGGGVANTGGGSISGDSAGVVVWEYGTVTNSGAGSLIAGNVGVDFTPFDLTGPFALSNEDGAEIEGNYAAARFYADGTVINSSGARVTGAINGLVFDDGASGTVVNQSGAQIFGGYAGVNFSGTGTLTNSGPGSTISADSYAAFFEYDEGDTINEDGAAIVSNNGSGVVYYAGGTVTNTSGASIDAKVSGVHAIGGDGTVTNRGPGSSIRGDDQGVFIADGAGTVVNSGGASISGGDSGVWLHDGGSVTNGAGSSISGSFAGIFTYGDAIVDNAGTVEGNVWMDVGAYNQVTLHTGSRINGELALENNSSSKLTLTGAGTQLYSEAVTGDTKFHGSLIKSGTGTWVLDKHLYAQYSSVGAGTLIVGTGGAGTLDSDVDVTSSGTLGGSGTIFGNLIVDGRVRPGNSIGVLTVGGYQQNAGSIYTVELDPGDNAADRIDATGVANLMDGAVLEVDRTGNAPYVAGSRYTVLSSAIGLSGAFELAGDIAPSAFLGLRDTYDARNAYLLVEQTRQLREAAGSANQQAVANGLQAAGPGNAAFDAVANLPDDAAAAAAFDQLDGDIHAGVPAALLGDRSLLRQAAIDRLRGALCMLEPDLPATGEYPCPEAEGEPTFWSTAYGGWQSGETLDNRTGGFLFGGDVRTFGDWRIGAYAGAGHTNVETDAQRATSNDYAIGAFAGGTAGNLALRFGAGAGRYDISTTRTVRFPGLAATLAGDYSATALDAFGEVAYRASFDHAAVEPFARLAWSGIATDSFAEQGGDAALGGAARLSLATLTLGIHTSMAFMLGDLPAEAGGTLGWSHTLGDPAAVAELAFAGGDSFGIAGAPTRDSALLALDLSVALGAGASLSLGYDGALQTEAARQALRGRLAVQF